MAGRYKPYSEYKDSEVEWLGEIPVGWSMTKMAWNFKAEKGKCGQLLTKDYCGLNSGEYAVYSGQTENEGVMGRINNFEFDVGESGVLFSTTVGAKAMHLSHLTGKFSLSQNCMIITPQSESYHVRFSFYHFQPLFAYERGLIPEHMQASFRMEDLYQYQTALPLMEEQEKIANFLDHETAKIDTLIEKQQQLIQLLKEKRQAVISHAVTKGLSSLSGGPNAKLRDSGVEWLGEVPESWVVGRYKFCTDRIVVGIAEAATHAYADSGVPILRSTNIKEEGLDTAGMLFITEEFAEKNSSKYLYADDVITVRTGYPGISAVIPKSLHRSQCFTNLVATPNSSMLPEFLAEYLNSHTGKSYFDLLGWGSAQKNISVPILQNIPIAYPVKDEQFKIIEFIRKTRWKFTVLIDKAEEQVALLQERRTALISAAVTGKIDVRDWVAPPASPTHKEVAA